MSSAGAPPAAAAAAAAAAPTAPTTTADASKIVVVLRAAGGAPILAQPKVKLSADAKFSKLVGFLRKQLKTDAVFVYLREAFCPSLDDDVGALAKAYGADGRLHVSYALTPAWG